MSIYRMVLTTVGKKRDGEGLATALVNKKLAACVQVIGPIRSFYTWKKKLCRDQEFLLLIKTTSRQVKSLEKELHRLHPYELPELVVLPIVGGSRRYLEWLNSQTAGR